MPCHSCNSVPFTAKIFCNAMSPVTRHVFTAAPQKWNVQAWKASITTDSMWTRKSKVTLSVGKVMATVFWCQKCMLVDFLEREAIINAAVYGVKLKCLRASIRHYCPGLLNKGVLHLHNNVRCQMAASVWEHLHCWIGPYSSNLVPSDVHISSALKEHLGDYGVKSDQDVRRAVT